MKNILLLSVISILCSCSSEQDQHEKWKQDIQNQVYFEKGKSVGRNAMMQYVGKHYPMSDTSKPFSIELTELLAIEDTLTEQQLNDTIK